VHQEDRVELGDPFHSLTQGFCVAGWKLVDPARAHERLEPHHATLDEPRELAQVARHQAAPKTEVDEG